MYNEITSCRVCGNSRLEPVFTLGKQVLTGVFPKSVHQKVVAGPLTLVKCLGKSSCGLLQLRESYSLESMYGDNYGYRSGLNTHMVSHLFNKVERILELGILEPGDTIFDIGSNDATTLKGYPEGYKLVGIDPTGAKFASYYPEQVRLIPDFFSHDTIMKHLGDTKAKVITSFSMFYDLEDPVAFARDICACLDDEGIWVFEQSYLPTMLETVSFDTICHEHLEFYAFKQIEWITKAAGMKVLTVEFNNINGGSFSITACKNEASRSADEDTLARLRRYEEDMQLDSLETYTDFAKQIENAGQSLWNFLDAALAENRSVYALGASTKGNVLLQHFGIDHKRIVSVAEVNEDKFGCYTPGTLIPIQSQEEVLAKNPDYLLVLPWHFKEFFVKNPLLKGHKLVFPLPELEIIEL